MSSPFKSDNGGSYHETADAHTRVTVPPKTAQEQSHERFIAARAWCQRHVPDYHPAMAASAALTLSLNGSWPSAKAVQTRLEQSRFAEFARKQPAA